MKIGIDISQIVYEGTGVARFTNGLVNSILDFDKKNTWFFFFSSFRRNLNQSLEKKIIDKGHILIKRRLPPTVLSLLFNNLHNFSKYLAFSFYLPTSLDWLITSDWVEPSLNIKKATVVHDLVYLRYPETVDHKILATQNRRLHWVKKESQIIFADSQATKKDLIDLLNIDSKKIFVNYPGVEIINPSDNQVKQTLKKYKLTKPFILTVGKLEPRKNIPRLIEAFNKIKDDKLNLVIVGPNGWSINNQISNIKFLGLISDTELYSLYSSCLFFIYPSIWEGFGYPVIEAMKFTAPVAASNTSSLKEILADGALLFDPLNIDEILLCIKRLKSDEKLKIELRKKGLKRSKIYTWLNYYKRMIKVLNSN